jgi:probable phosphoglycerate mutase
MEELFLVRHGQSVHHVKGLTGGWTNTPLTELGRQQAQLTGQELKKRLADLSVAFYTSDLERALQTAQIIAKVLGITPVAEEALRELNWGVVVDMTLEEARKFEQEKTEPLLDWSSFP